MIGKGGELVFLYAAIKILFNVKVLAHLYNLNKINLEENLENVNFHSITVSPILFFFFYVI